MEAPPQPGTEPPAASNAANKMKRKVKALPDLLANLTEENFHTKLRARLETDEKEPDEVQVAFEVVVTTEEGDTTVDLTKLTLDQLRKLCRNCGVQYVNSCTKFQCRKCLWVRANYKLKKQRDGIENAVLDKTTNNIVRITNIVFSREFVDSFISLNDAKNRGVDHEKGVSPKDFWADVADVMNGAEEDDASVLQVFLEEDDNYYDDIMDINLRDFDVMTSDAIKKKVNHLLKVRKIVQNNMTISGEHDNDALNFMEVAIRTAGMKGVSVLGAYYFYKRCDSYPEVDVRPGVEIDDALHGNTDNAGSTSTNKNRSNEDDSTPPKSGGDSRKRTYAAIEYISNVARDIADEMKETNKFARMTAEAMKEKNELVRQSQIIQLAQHLGKQEILETLLASLLSSTSGDGPE